MFCKHNHKNLYYNSKGKCVRKTKEIFKKKRNEVTYTLMIMKTY